MVPAQITPPHRLVQLDRPLAALQQPALACLEITLPPRALQLDLVGLDLRMQIPIQEVYSEDQASRHLEAEAPPLGACLGAHQAEILSDHPTTSQVALSELL